MISTLSCFCCHCSKCDTSDDNDEHEQTRSLVPKIKEDSKDLSSFSRQPPWRKEKLRKKVAIEKKYHLKLPECHTTEGSKAYLTTENILLKIAIKMSDEADKIKITAIEANNVVTVMKSKSCELPSSASPLKHSKFPTIQLHTKELSTSVRNYSKLHKVTETITGAVKFSNECIYSFSAEDIRNRVDLPKLRFRLYHILKPHMPLSRKNKILLGEYNLDLGALNLHPTINNVLMQLHDTDAKHVFPPEVFAVHRSPSPFEKMHRQAYERLEKLDDLKANSEAMNEEASTLCQQSISIRKKLEKEAEKMP